MKAYVTFCALVAAFFLPAGGPLEPVVEITGGQVRGLPLEGGGAVFKGIPYAAPPVGALRWREPQPVIPWSGVRDATEYGPSCPQSQFANLPLPTISEDCLFLHVWTPAWPAASPSPVMVWIHGGGNFMGNAVERGAMDGESLTRHGVVVVSFNYRLGSFGFFSHPELTRESPHQASGNQGILDQIAALQWVQQNIARFGGDPGNVTIFGESAGSFDVQLLLTTPLARGLFRQAIGQSGSVMTAGGKPRGLAEAESDGEALAKTWPGQGAMSLDGMRAVPAADILAADPQFMTGKWPSLGVIVDGYVFSESPAKVFAAGKALGVPLILGSNAHDRISGTRPEELPSSIAAQLGPLAPKAAEVYQGEEDPVHGSIEMQWDVDRTFRCPSVAQLVWHSAAGNPGWQFEFARAMPGSPGPGHFAEVPYVFGTVRKPEIAGRFGKTAPDESDYEVSAAMQAYWTNFAKHGDPNGFGLPVWPRFDPEKRAYIQFTGEGPLAGEGLRRTACELFVESLTARFGGQ